MKALNPYRWLLVGGGLLVVGAVLPFLMVIRVLEPTFLLSFISFGATASGFLTGFLGLALYGFRMRG
jgi:hypothetical protein